MKSSIFIDDNVLPSTLTIVQNILNNHLQNHGKLIRSTLTTKLAQLLGLNEDIYRPICWASETIHNASLIHDDVVDEATIRRDKPTLNTKISNSKAVLAGDYLLASVIAELVKLNQFAILRTLSEALEQIVEGEFLQDSLKTKASTTIEDLVSISNKKTGALLSWNCHSVAVVANLNSYSQELCRKIGLKLGLAFQMMDDNLDFSRNSGKEFAKDLKEGLINFTTLNLIHLYPEIYYSVYQLKGNQFTDGPWSDEQISHAIGKTTRDADILFDEVYRLLSELCGHNLIDMASREYKDLLIFLNHLQQRKK